jgi:hypothetical protein
MTFFEFEIDKSNLKDDDKIEFIKIAELKNKTVNVERLQVRSQTFF